ncbi:hypothetical protein BCR32DRAFT_263960 [Anaeromyces robustus]|uniref:Uncharacterized protein n=1 Tax=Anaeromyces robustus TaxID=1754192 RepID=A0A1Y1XQ73_9FUNG|nr:hypothetical protein BCR32DRAFT_263960 [Anaeromyces robustus]|eukprot:ORX87910.1 hypothetical protein BCR32DRAFT_263960 [Anaeromyces robustus]
MTISKTLKTPLEVSTETIFSHSVSTNRNVDTSPSISVALFTSQANALNSLQAISSTNNLSSNTSAINTISDNAASLSAHDPNLITSLKEINSSTEQLSNLNTYTQNNNIALLAQNKNKNNSTTKIDLNSVETNVIDTNNINANIQNSILSSVQTISSQPTLIDIDVLDLHQSSKWKDAEVKKILNYLRNTDNFQKYCKEKKTKTYNKLASILTTKTSAQIKNKLSSLESSYRKVKMKYQEFLQNFNPKDVKQIKYCKDKVLKEFPFFFEMDEIFHAKLQNGKFDSSQSSSPVSKINYKCNSLSSNKDLESNDISSSSVNNLLTSFFDLETIQKLLKRNSENLITNDELQTQSDNSDQTPKAKNANIDDVSIKSISNTELNDNSIIINNTLKDNNKKRRLHETDILEISSSAKQIINIIRESEEKRLKLQQEYDDKRLLLKKLLAEKEWENKIAIEEKKLEIQKQHNKEMKALKERELDLEESKQKIEREKLELEKVQVNLQIKLYEEKLINHFQHNDLSRGLNSINSTLATLNNLNNLSSVQVLQNNNNLKLDNQKK